MRSRTDGTPYASGAEIQHFGSTAGRQQFRDNAQQVVTRQWQAGGQPQPPPNTIINGNNSLSAAYGSTGTAGELLDSTDAANRQIAGRSTTDTQQSPHSDLLQNRTSQAQGSNTSTGVGVLLVYPTTLRQQGSSAQDTLKLQMLEYTPKSFGLQPGNLSGIGSRPKNRTRLGSVVLPIPGGIMDSNTVSWGSDSMSAVDIGVASAALSLLQDEGTKTGAKLSSAMKAAQTSSAEIKQALGASLAGMAAGKGSGMQIMQRVDGQILNPNMELLFNNPALRQFNFSWKLAPRSSQEARTIIQIIRFFKQGMAPIRQEPNLFLKSPNTFQLTYKHKASDHRFLNKFKECALLNCGLQYTPDGNYATYEDGVMTAYQMTLSFQELDPVYSDDYEGINNTEIGF